MMITKRACIYPKDIQRITGRSERYCRKLINKIKEYLDKEPHQFLTVKDFANYSGIEEDIINKYLID
jgi:tRNA U34 5-carboxymethylaminomethyl modifying enzyme MnmG/GidA